MTESLIIACPQCNQLNRVPKSKISADGKCGSCGKPLINEQVINLNQDSFQRHIDKSELPILVDFWAPWCGPCKMMAPVLDEAAIKLSPNVRVAKVNTEVEQTLAARFNIRSIPTLAIFFKGKELDRMAGALPLPQVLQWTNQTLTR